jgi:CHAD domain-containing protein
MREVELKLEVDEPFESPSFSPRDADLGAVEELDPLDLRASYYDTSDLRLARHGITLRYRTGEEGSAWTLKLPVQLDTVAREELAFGGTNRKVPDGARDLVTAFVRSSSLTPVARLRTRRRRWCLRDTQGTEVAELVDDRVSVLRNSRVVARFRELEVESRSSDRRPLERVSKALQRAGATQAKPIPKAIRALGQRALEPPDYVVVESPSRSDPAAYAVQAAIGRGLRRIVLNDPGARLGDAEAVHQMRVGTRRLRADLRTFAPLLLKEPKAYLRAELRWLGAALGEVRDLDVIRSRLRSDASGLDADLEPLFTLLDNRYAEARTRLLDALRSDRYVALLDSLVEANQSPALAPSAREPCGKALPPLAAKPWRKLIRSGRALKRSSPYEKFHQVRIRAKAARYAAEAVAPALGSKLGKQAGLLARRAAAVQDLLGELQDAVVAAKVLQEAADTHATSGAFKLALVQLIERQEAEAKAAREAFSLVWKKLDKDEWGKWLTS